MQFYSQHIASKGHSEDTMKIEKHMSAEAVLAELGQRVARRRVGLGLTQAHAAEEAGIGKRTVERIEAGGDTQLTTLIRLLRVLDLVDELNRLVPEPGPRPMDLLKLKGKERKRASSRRSNRSERGDWQWGDNQ
jgi:transcriptional regulator with XRE-family HTH domain